MKKLLMTVLLAWLGGAGALAQTPPAHTRALEAIARFLERIQDPDAGEFRTKMAQGRIDIGPTSRPEVAGEAQPGVDHVRLRETILRELFDPRGNLQTRAVMAWAGTWKHERDHTLQRRPNWAVAWWQDVAGKGNFCETHAWEAGFQAYWNWFQATQERLAKARSVQEKEALWQQLVQLGDIMQEYQQEYAQQIGYSPMKLDVPEGTISAPQVLEQIARSRQEALEQAPLTVVINPGHYQARAGESVPFVAVARGLEPLSYAWSWNGKPVAQGRKFTLVAQQSGTLGLVATDGRLRKASASAAITVSQSLTVRLPERLSLARGQQFRLEAQAQGGSPPLTYRWSRDGAPLKLSSQVGTGKADKSMTVQVQVVDALGQKATAACRVEVAEVRSKYRILLGLAANANSPGYQDMPVAWDKPEMREWFVIEPGADGAFVFQRTFTLMHTTTSVTGSGVLLPGGQLRLTGTLTGGQDYSSDVRTSRVRFVQADRGNFSLSGTVKFQRRSNGEVYGLDFTQAQFEGNFDSTMSLTDLGTQVTNTYRCAGSYVPKSSGIESLEMKK